MDRIDIDGLSEEELIDLNHRVVARLRLMREMRAHSEMLEFRNGGPRCVQARRPAASNWHCGSLQPPVCLGRRGFWRAMDTLRDRQALEDLVEQGHMPWRVRGPA